MGATEYTTAVDMWSVGCIFAELMQKEALFQGRGEIDQISRVGGARGRARALSWRCGAEWGTGTVCDTDFQAARRAQRRDVAWLLQDAAVQVDQPGWAAVGAVSARKRDAT